MTWDMIAARIAENDAEKPNPLRAGLFDSLRGTSLQPNGNATKYMVGFKSEAGEKIVWELKGAARNFFVAPKWEVQAKAVGLGCERRPYVMGEKDGKRHSALNRPWSFPERDCLRVLVNTTDDLQKLIAVIDQQVAEPVLFSAAITRWIARLRQFFPDLVRFDRPDPDFDASEREYKIDGAARLTAALASAPDDTAVLEAVHDALAKSNLLSWRVYWPMSPKGNGDVAKIAAALRALVAAAQGPADDHPRALADFVAAWLGAVPDAQRDPARQIGEFLLMHLSPDTGIYIRHSVREDFWREAYGAKFPASDDLAEIYRQEHAFMTAIRDAFIDRGLAPRDMIDVQSALWVAHSYTEEQVAQEVETEAEMSDLTSPTNLILYGPPGTGKTYATAWEAVRLCLGEAADPLQYDRPALMSEYQRLCDEGRIEFTTFHQSMSYEDFVEGLRPETEAAVESELPEAAPRSGGFSLRPHNGIFRRISENARLDVGENGAMHRLDRNRRIVRLGLTGGDWRKSFEQILSAGQIDWPLGGDIDWSGPEYEEWEAIKVRRQRDDPKLVGNQAPIYGTWVVRAAAEVGDYIILTVGKGQIVALGRFSGPYEYTPASERGATQHTRSVEWIWHDPEGVPRQEIYASPFTSFHPIYFLSDDQIDWDGLESAVFGPVAEQSAVDARPYVLIIDEINRANISKVFGELITLLEPDKRLGAANEIRLRLPYSGRLFGVPSNLHVVGTMNTADRSIALLDTALRRRFSFRELMPEPEVLPKDCDGIDLRKLLATINARIEYLFDREHQVGHAYFTTCRSRADIGAVMRDKVIPLLAEYFHEDLAKVALVLGDAPGRPVRFLQADRLQPPQGMAENEFVEEKWRWLVADSFDFAEFEADGADT
ncbi:hypothetical protein BMI91_00175 [Thioclava sediminum]|uniref:AAA+ ATPase domain-containing protein n=1 Tax=Thioclava sediminum TaxID=1915319 RepID=A0ABX3N374_9RHOB|nr:AAA family ATPase [Thioclava sediminum]OOY24904.1 hypothetical protein BMI91_00175 [Thioclava sediminum]